MDAILQALEDARKKAARLFESKYPGGIYGNGNNTFQINSVDAKGYLHITNLQTGEITTVDPQPLVYSNFNPQDPTGSGSTSTLTGGGGPPANPLTNVMGAAQTGSGIWQQINQGKQNKILQGQNKTPQTWGSFAVTANDGNTVTLPGDPQQLKNYVQGAKAQLGQATVQYANAQGSLTGAKAAFDFRTTNQDVFINSINNDYAQRETLLNQSNRDITRRIAGIESEATLSGAMSPDQYNQIKDLKTQIVINNDKLAQLPQQRAAEIQRNGIELDRTKTDVATAQVNADTAKTAMDQARDNYDHHQAYANAVESYDTTKFAPTDAERQYAQDQLITNGKTDYTDGDITRQVALNRQSIFSGITQDEINGAKLNYEALQQNYNQVDDIRQTVTTEWYDNQGLTPDATLSAEQQANLNGYVNDNLYPRVYDKYGDIQYVDKPPATFEQYFIDERAKVYQNGLGDGTDKLEQQMLRGAEKTAGISAVAAFGTAFGYEAVLEKMWKKGASFTGILEAGGLFGGLFGSLHVLHNALWQQVGWYTDNSKYYLVSQIRDNISGVLTHVLGSALGNAIGNGLAHALNFLTSTPGILAITGALTLWSWIQSKPSSEDAALTDLNQAITPTIWSNGPVMLITAGLALSSMGLDLSPTAPMMETRTRLETVVTGALAQATGGQMPNAQDRYSTVFVQQGNPNDPNNQTKVVYLTFEGYNSHGEALDTVHMVNLGSNVQFTNPGAKTYLPFFSKNRDGTVSPNLPAIHALTMQQQLLNASNAVGTTDAQKLTTSAGATNSGATPIH